MESLFFNISQVLGVSILHSLWQGLIVYIVLRIFTQSFPNVSAGTKYIIGLSALALITACFAGTIFNQLGKYEWFTTTQLVAINAPIPIEDFAKAYHVNSYYIGVTNYMPYIAAIYIAGLFYNLLKLSLAWANVKRIRNNSTPAKFDSLVIALSQKLQLTKTINVAFSEWVDVPCITGLIKPIVLLPFSITCYLNAEEVEAILLHELAHVKRNDYLVNFIQKVISILLFFNPFARLVNSYIDSERENCCDDLVVQYTNNAFNYARALLKLEENRKNWQLALYAASKKHQLLTRIERIMKTTKPTIDIRPVIITVLALVCSLTSIAWLNPKIENGNLTSKNGTKVINKISVIINEPVVKPAKNIISAQVTNDITLTDNTLTTTAPKEDPKPNDTLFKIHNTIEWIKFRQDLSNRAAHSTSELYKTAVYKQYRETIAAAETVWKQSQQKLAGTPASWKLRSDMPGFFDPKVMFNTADWKEQQRRIKAAEDKLNEDEEWKKLQAARDEQYNQAYAKLTNSIEWKQHDAVLAATNEKLGQLADWREAQQLDKSLHTSLPTEPQRKGMKAKLAILNDKLAKVPEWQQQQKIIEDANGKLYLSNAWIERGRAMQKADDDLNNAAAFKQKEQEVAAAETAFKKTDTWQKQQTAINKVSGKLYSSKEWKKYNDEKNAAATKLYNSPEWKKYIAEGEIQVQQNSKTAKQLIDSLKE